MTEIDNNKFMWITWEWHRRSVELANEFKAQLFMYDTVHKFRTIRYLFAGTKTLVWLVRFKPAVVFSQNPSIVLNLLLCLCKRIIKFKLIVDRHSNFKLNAVGTIKYKLFNYISDYTLRKSNLVIVTNEYLKEMVLARGGNAVVLQDRLPKLDQGGVAYLSGSKNFVCISSYDTDEPIEELINAFECCCADNYHLYLTGNYKKSKYVLNRIRTFAGNIHFTGYLNESSYQELLRSADVVIVLTKREHTLNCGAYEAVALEKPMILANTQTIKNYFVKGAVYTDMTMEGIRKSIHESIYRFIDLKMESRTLRADLEKKWLHKKNDVLVEILKLATES